MLVWCGIDGIATEGPTDGAGEVPDGLSGGGKSRRDPGYWRRFRSACGRYDGPALPFFVACCKAPDGSDWALQAWQWNRRCAARSWTERQKPSSSTSRTGAARFGSFRSTAAGRMAARSRASLVGSSTAASPSTGRELLRRPSATNGGATSRSTCSTRTSGPAGGTTRQSRPTSRMAASATVAPRLRRRLPEDDPRNRPRRAPSDSAIGPGVTLIVQATILRLTASDAEAQRQAMPASTRFSETTAIAPGAVIRALPLRWARPRPCRPSALPCAGASRDNGSWSPESRTPPTGRAHTIRNLRARRG